MTPESQRIALAKWAGWKNIREGKLIPGGMVGKLGDEVSRLPDFLHDLNAVHELEEKLKTAAEAMQFAVELSRLVGKPFQPAHELGLWEGWKLAHATAAQRCEALLRTLGLWEA